MLLLALKSLVRRPVRVLLTLFGLAISVALLLSLSAFGKGYQRALHSEIDRMGIHLMLVPLGCPYDAAARVLKGNPIENSLPQDALLEVRRDPAVIAAAPLLLTAVSRLEEGRTDMWAGIDETSLLLKPWWKPKSGTRWFRSTNSVILGAEAAEVEMRHPGDKLFSPEARRTFEVDGTLERSGTSDDSLFFVPLKTAQQVFGREDRLTAIAIRLRDPSLLLEVTARLQQMPGVQAVTLTEMMGAFLNLLGSVRVLLGAIAAIAVIVSAFGMFNTFMAAIVERSGEFAVIRALGASRLQVFSIIALEAILLAISAGALGLLLSLCAGRSVEDLVKKFVPFAPTETLWSFAGTSAWQALTLTMTVGVLAGCYPAWRASRVQPALALKEN